MGMDGGLHFHLDTLRLVQEISLVLGLSISLRTMVEKNGGSLHITETLDLQLMW